MKSDQILVIRYFFLQILLIKSKQNHRALDTYIRNDHINVKKI